MPRVPRFFAPDLPETPGDPFELTGEEAVHLARVLRLKPGARIELFDGRGSAGRFEVVAVDRRRSELRLEARTDEDRELPFELTCAVSPPKGKRAQRLVEGLTELGVTTLVPLVLERSQNKLPPPEQMERWSLEAAKQCGRNRLLRTPEPMDLAGLQGLAPSADLAILADTQQAQPLRSLLEAPRPRRVLLTVGPEGGFSDSERAALVQTGFQAARLGTSILRIETAACAVAAALIAAWA